jgi:hypothetical protein
LQFGYYATKLKSAFIQRFQASTLEKDTRTKTQSMVENEIGKTVVDAAIAVHPDLIGKFAKIYHNQLM